MNLKGNLDLPVIAVCDFKPLYSGWAVLLIPNRVVEIMLWEHATLSIHKAKYKTQESSYIFKHHFQDFIESIYWFRSDGGLNSNPGNFSSFSLLDIMYI